MYVIGMVRMQVMHACALIPLPFYTILEVYILCNQSIPQKVYKKYIFGRNEVSVEYTI